MQTVRVNASKSYDVIIGSGALAQIKESSRQSLVVTQPGALEHAKTVANALDARVCELPDGEEAKSLEQIERLYEFALEVGLERSDFVLAVGGGCVGDAAGFFAATFMRGLPLVHVPTTLVAQVDSSVGGKVAVNVGKTKNIVGAFYQPKAVYADINTLQTLPKEQLQNGLAEVIKYGLITDHNFFEYVEENVEELLKKNETVLEHVVAQSVRLKAEVVEKDEFETNERMKLNYGHTVGHGIEAVAGLPHGFAISVGMVAEALISEQRGFRERERQNALFEKAGLLLTTKADADEVMQKIRHDKKRARGKMRMALLEKIGSCRIAEVSEEEIRTALEEVLK